MNTIQIERMGKSQLSLTNILVISLAVAVLLGVTNAISPIVTVNVMAICIFALALGIAMLFVFNGVVKQDPNSPEVVASEPDAMSANAIVGLLKDNGINATVTGSYTSGFQTEVASDVNVVVPFRDAETAKEIIASSRPQE